MGEEIADSHFEQADFERFGQRLREETRALGALIDDGALRQGPVTAGLELECWLIDERALPAARNAELLEALADPMVVPELSRFNVELNVEPVCPDSDGLRALERELDARWARCQAACRARGLDMLAIGTLPTLRNTDLSPDSLSASNRYRAMNEQILRQRGGRALRVRIDGRERLEVSHHDVLLEAASTSLQLHLKPAQDQVLRYYNASLIASAPLLAASANAPYLFQRDLWAETRIPVFEQACDFPGPAAAGGARRIGFGSGYLRQSPAEYFRENEARFPVLLPVSFDAGTDAFHHLRLHNGTIWRWNRLLAGPESDGGVHLRIEQRVLPAGPSLADMLANLAFYLGLVRWLAEQQPPPEQHFDFASARAGFYAAAREGLAAGLPWLDGRTHAARTLLSRLLPRAAEGLQGYGGDSAVALAHLRNFERRLDSGRTGAQWQCDWVARHGRNFPALVQAYRERQHSGAPVWQWAL